MHVLVAAHDLYPDPGSGGTGRYVYETALELVSRGHRVTVVTRRRGSVPRRETVAGVDVHRYDVSIAGESASAIVRRLPGAARDVRRAVESATADRPVDVVSFQGPLTSLFVHRAVADAVPRVLTFHSPWPTEYDIKARSDPAVSARRRRLNVRLRRATEARVVAAADRRIVLSEFMGDQLSRVYGREDARVVPGGVDAERFTPAADGASPLDDAGFAFLTVRRLSERMGHATLVDAFARAAPRLPEAELFVAGDGPLRESLERRTEAAGVEDRVTFLGYVPDDDLPAVYAGADAFVLPTVELEGFGLATMEALAAGTPAVGTAVGGTVDVLGGWAAEADLPADPLVPEPAAAPLARSMTEWASLDGDALAAAGRDARRYAREHTWEAVVDDLEAEYEGVVSEAA